MTISCAERAYRALDLIDKYPEQHDQRIWIKLGEVEQRADESYMEWRDRLRTHTATLDSFTGRCGTTACFAGWVVMDAGLEINDLQLVYGENGEPFGPVPTVAADLLGLEDRKRDRHLLFSAVNIDLAGTVRDIFGPDPRAAAIEPPTAIPSLRSREMASAPQF